MSEKRFVKDHSYLVNYDKYCILDKVQYKHLYLDEVCQKLNELAEENEQLRRDISIVYNKNKELMFENENLKYWNKCLAEKRHGELDL